MTELDEAEIIATRIVAGGIEIVPYIIDEEILLLAHQFIEVIGDEGENKAFVGADS